MANRDPYFIGATKVQGNPIETKYEEHGSSCHN